MQQRGRPTTRFAATTTPRRIDVHKKSVPSSSSLLLLLLRRGVVLFLILACLIWMLLASSFFLSPRDSTSITNSLWTVPTTASQAHEQHENEEPTRVVAHVISLITCHRADRVQGFRDALVMLRHSIHQNSVHVHPHSRYSYQMYAVLHKDGGCDAQLPLLQRLGYIPLLHDTPVDIDSITTNEWYKTHVENENCCGSKEFIKLYAYTLVQHPIVVHWDLDVTVLKPMDDLYNAMLYDKDSEQGRVARQRLHLERPQYQTLPDRIDAFWTRDVTSSAPWEHVQAVQGGFVVARPSMEHFELYRQFILEANYTKGRGPTSGWGGMVRVNKC